MARTCLLYTSFLGIPKRILKKIQSLALTIRNFCDKINWWKEFLDHPRTREALSFLWKNAKKLIYHVLPTRITGKITFGNDCLLYTSHCDHNKILCNKDTKNHAHTNKKQHKTS